jgi:hypothetical protein
VSGDVHVFILWSAAAPQADRIVADLRRKFELLDAYRITWAPDRFAENVRRFYGADLPERLDKAAGSGAGPFVVYVVRDPEPVYAPRLRSSGDSPPANAKAYDSKQRYREWTGGGFRVHATNTPDEAARDVFLLLGRTLESYAGAPSVSWDREPVALSAGVVGADDVGARRRAGQRTAVGTVRALKLRAPRLARFLAAVSRPVRRRALENARRRATIRKTSSHGGDDFS